MRPLALAFLLALPSPALADWALDLVGTGQREYYCTGTVRLTNQSDAPLTELSGFFLIHLDGEQVGRSKGTWFMNVPPGGTAEAVFETPNAPCAEADRWEFVVGACRVDAGFEDKAACAARIDVTAPLVVQEE
ncbi:MAG: hypothetical protein AAGF30_12730 [Pseudomonadota bacterium]